MADGRRGGTSRISLNERSLVIIIQSLFSSWMLAFLFEGQIFYSLAETFDLAPAVMVFSGIAAHFAGLLFCGFFIKTREAARRLFLCSYPFCIAVSVIFFFPPSVFWMAGIVAGSFLAGSCVAAWGYYLKSSTPKNERIKTVADMLIFSNVLMILLNMAAIHISPHIGLALSMLMLLGAFAFALRLPADHAATSPVLSRQKENPISIAKPLVFYASSSSLSPSIRA